MRYCVNGPQEARRSGSGGIEWRNCPRNNDSGTRSQITVNQFPRGGRDALRGLLVPNPTLALASGTNTARPLPAHLLAHPALTIPPALVPNVGPQQLFYLKPIPINFWNF